MAIPNAVLTFIAATIVQHNFDPKGFSESEFNEEGTSNAFSTKASSEAAQAVITAFTMVMIFILYNRSRTSYNRWWEGGTLLQKTRGEWFNAYSSIMAFTSTKPELAYEVESYCHLVSRLFSLLMCCGLQQVSPHRDRPFEIIDLAGIEAESMEFLNSAPDKVEVILQWIQRSMVLHMQSGVLPIAPPVLSRAFQEVSRGIVNLQNARKIADFPYPYPLAQVSMILQLLHWAITPIASAFALPRAWAVLLSFFSIFVLWCIHFNALDLEFPFGSRVNDLPMNEFQQEWNNSIITLLDSRATRPPKFVYDSVSHGSLNTVMSDASELYVPKAPPPLDKGSAVIKIAELASQSENMMRTSRTIRRSMESLGEHLPSIDEDEEPLQGEGSWSSADAWNSEKRDQPAGTRLGKPASRQESPDSFASDATLGTAHGLLPIPESTCVPGHSLVPAASSQAPNALYAVAESSRESSGHAPIGQPSRGALGTLANEPRPASTAI